MKLPKQINKLLYRKNSNIVGLITQAQQIAFLNNILLNLLPSPLPLHCNLGKIDKQTLVIIVDSPTWSARLRYCIPDLLAKLKHHSHYFIPVKKIEIKVKPRWQTKPVQNTLKPVPISQKTADCLIETANTIENKAIKTALLKIAKNTQ